jgi:hypothetical protein
MAKRYVRRPAGVKEYPTRSVRIADEVWERARRRASLEGVTISHVLSLMVEGYASGLLDMPRTQVVYAPPKKVEAASAPEDG